MENLNNKIERCYNTQSYIWAYVEELKKIWWHKLHWLNSSCPQSRNSGGIGLDEFSWENPKSCIELNYHLIVQSYLKHIMVLQPLGASIVKAWMKGSPLRAMQSSQSINHIRNVWCMNDALLMIPAFRYSSPNQISVMKNPSSLGPKQSRASLRCDWIEVLSFFPRKTRENCISDIY